MSREFSVNHLALSKAFKTVSVEVAPASVPIATPDAPVLLVDKDDIWRYESVSFSWDAVANATSYELKNITDGTTTSVSGTSITVTPENETMVKIIVQYTVTAINETGGQVVRSSESNTVSVTVKY